MSLIKSLTALCISVLFTGSAAGQIAYYDALQLAEEDNIHEVRDDGKVILSHNSSVYAILGNYVEIPTGIDTATAIQRALSASENPFIAVQFSAQSVAGGISFLSSAAGSVGNLNISTFADGLTRFLIERSKQELTVAFFGRFKDIFKDYPEIRTLFPTTSEYIRLFDTYQYAAMIDALRDAFISDLDNLPDHIQNLEEINKPVYKEFFRSNEGKLLLTALELTNPVRQGTNVAELLDFLAENPHFNQLDDSFSQIPSFVKLSQLFSNSLRSRENRIWIDSKQVRNFVESKNAFRIYMGLIYQQSAGIFFEKSETATPFREILSDYSTDITVTQSAIRNLSYTLELINQNRKEIEKKLNTGEKLTVQEIHNYVNSFKDALKGFGEFSQVILQIPDFEKKLDHLYRPVNHSLNLFSHIQQKNYTSAVLDASLLMNEIDSTLAFNDKFIKYGTFIAVIAESESAEQVQKAIEAVVLPPGSSRIKRTSKYSIDINAYLGGFAGNEKLRENDKAAFTYGVWAPVGLSFSTGAYKLKTENGRYNEYGSFSFFLSVIDVGAFASFRFEDTEEELPEFQLKNIIAPGAFFIYGIPRTPVSLSAGIQLGPQVRNISDGVESSAYRFVGGVSVDVPFFNLKAVPRK